MGKILFFLCFLSLNLQAQTCLQSIECVEDHQNDSEISPDYCDLNNTKNMMKLNIKLKKDGKLQSSQQAFGPYQTLSGLSEKEQQCSMVENWKEDMKSLKLKCQLALEAESKKWPGCKKKRTIPSNGRVNDSSVEKILIERESNLEETNQVQKL